MPHFASREQALHAASIIGDVVDSQTTVPFIDDSGEYDVTHVPVETPSIIGSKLAVSLRLAKARKSELKAVATYYDNAQCEGIPLRHLTLSQDGEALGVFDGTMNANSYRLPASYITALEADLTPVISQAK